MGLEKPINLLEKVLVGQSDFSFKHKPRTSEHRRSLAENDAIWSVRAPLLEEIKARGIKIIIAGVAWQVEYLDEGIKTVWMVRDGSENLRQRQKKFGINAEYFSPESLNELLANNPSGSDQGAPSVDK